MHFVGYLFLFFVNLAWMVPTTLFVLAAAILICLALFDRLLLKLLGQAFILPAIYDHLKG